MNPPSLADRDAAVEHWTHVGHAFRDRGERERAIKAYRRAAMIDPGNPTCPVNLAFTYLESGRLEEADSISRQLLAMLPHYPQAQILRAVVCEEFGNHQQSLFHLDEAVRLNPASPDARRVRANQLLRIGRFSEGWAEHEWRHQCADYSSPRYVLKQPQWQGEGIAGRTMLLHSEQGMGDTVHFARYAPLVAARGARVLLETQRPLARLMKGIPGVAAVIARGDPLPDTDVHCPLLSLPHIFGTRLETIPAKVPYLEIDREVIEAWRGRISGAHVRVGLVWAGNPQHPRDHMRSMTIKDCLPLLGIRDIDWYSLQVDRPSDKLPKHLVSLAGDLTDFLETAGAILHLDLVVSVDTAVAHIAGALGRPVWLLLPTVADWRYHSPADSTPWYPSMRLFRQTQRGNWREPIARISSELRRLIESGATQGRH